MLYVINSDDFFENPKSTISKNSFKNTRPRGYKTFVLLNSTRSMLFQLLIKAKMLKNNLELSDVVFILLINVKMPTIVGILTFMSRINFMPC